MYGKWGTMALAADGFSDLFRPSEDVNGSCGGPERRQQHPCEACCPVVRTRVLVRGGGVKHSSLALRRLLGRAAAPVSRGGRSVVLAQGRLSGAEVDRFARYASQRGRGGPAPGATVSVLASGCVTGASMDALCELLEEQSAREGNTGTAGCSSQLRVEFYGSAGKDQQQRRHRLERTVAFERLPYVRTSRVAASLSAPSPPRRASSGVSSALVRHMLLPLRQGAGDGDEAQAAPRTALNCGGDTNAGRETVSQHTLLQYLHRLEALVAAVGVQAGRPCGRPPRGPCKDDAVRLAERLLSERSSGAVVGGAMGAAELLRVAAAAAPALRGARATLLSFEGCAAGAVSRFLLAHALLHAAAPTVQSLAMYVASVLLLRRCAVRLLELQVVGRLMAALPPRGDAVGDEFETFLVAPLAQAAGRRAGCAVEAAYSFGEFFETVDALCPALRRVVSQAKRVSQGTSEGSHL